MPMRSIRTRLAREGRGRRLLPPERRGQRRRDAIGVKRGKDGSKFKDGKDGWVGGAGGGEKDDAVRFGFQRRSKAGNDFRVCRSAGAGFFFPPCRAMKLYVGSCIIGLHKFWLGLDLCPTQIFCYIYI
jgi:hypothetical protein